MAGNVTKQFRQGLAIKQVGAKPIRTKRGTVFQLGGGIFSKRQIVASRYRYARTFVPKQKIGKAKFGL